MKDLHLLGSYVGMIADGSLSHTLSLSLCVSNSALCGCEVEKDTTRNLYDFSNLFLKEINN
jgi:hypothetical protein